MSKTNNTLKEKYKEIGLVRSFGRIKSRKLSNHKNDLLKNLLPKYQIKDSDLQQPCDKKNSLEIGFGFGDFTFEKAKNNPEIDFFASEPHINGVVNLLSKLENEPLENLYISCQDVRMLLENFPNNFFDQVYILFPDPWPKLKHFKRRLINADFLDKILAPKMKNLSKLTIATDHDSYKTWILSTIFLSKKFNWSAESKSDWQNFPKDWVETKYQKKAALEGRESVIFNLIYND